MRRLLHYLKRHPVITVLAPLFKMLEATFELFVPVVVARMIDVGIAGKDKVYLFKMGGLLVLLGVAGLAFSVTAQYFAAKSAVRTGQAIRSDLFAHINTLSYREIDGVGTSTLINRMTGDINQVQSGLNMFLRLFLRSPFVVFGCMVMAFVVGKRAALPFAVVIPALLLVVFAILLFSMPLYRGVQKRLDRVLLDTRENLLGIRVVRAFSRQKEEKKAFRFESENLYRRQIFVGKISALLNPLTYVIVNLGVVAILYTGGRQVDAGTLTQGQVIALVNYMTQILTELVKLANLMILLSRALASLSRVNAVFDMKASIPEEGAELRVTTASPVPAVSFDHVGFVFAGEREETLHDISFEALPGQTVGIIGGTGSGKSTLAQLIPRFYEASSGQISLYGQDIRTLRPSSVRGHIGVVPQKATVFSGTLLSNMRWRKKDADEAEIYRALDTAQAREFVESKGEGLSLRIEQGGGNLSGGQKQRLTIARALLADRRLLILDEATSNVDTRTEILIQKAMDKLMRGRTCFVIAHRLSTIVDSDLILVLRDGQIVETGRHEELLARRGFYYDLYTSQYAI